MKKVLMLASVASMIDKFNMENIKILRDLGYSVDVAANFDFGSITSQERVDEFKQELVDSGITVHNIQIPRKVFDIKGIVNSYKKVKKLSETENYSMIHCHSPIGGVVARLAFRKARKRGTKVVYTAHGFHFYKGAALLNWLIYFPLEWVCSFFTDVLITINKEDFEFAQRKMKAKKIEYIHGIGIDISRFGTTECDKRAKSDEIGLPEDAIMLLSVGELSKRKNQEIIIRALQQLNNKKLHYVLAGFGEKEEYLKQLAIKSDIADRVHFLGYRSDISDLCNMTDVFCFPSLQEGLPVALMEAMATGLPVVCSEIRGNTDLIREGQGGFLCKPDDINMFAKRIDELSRNVELRSKMKYVNLENIKKFGIDNVNKEMKRVYKDTLNGNVEN